MTTTPSAPAPATAKLRVESADFLRGAVMIIMALDHVRGFLSNAGVDPVDVSRTWPALFFTRWITHFCAPVFIFLAGTSAWFAGTRRTKAELCQFLWTRGLWLVFLELTLVRFGWRWEFRFHEFNAGAVIWAIGWSMVFLSCLIFLPTRVVGGFGLAMIVLHHTLDGVKSDAWGSAGWLWKVLHEGGLFDTPWGGKFAASYPLIPWIGVMAAGYAFGSIFAWDSPRRRQFLFRGGAAILLGFVILRAWNVYGDPSRWSSQRDAMTTLMSFLNCSKYPPSLLYLAMTLGPAWLLMGCIDRPLGAWAKPVLVFGRVPLFYYLLHLPLIHLIAIGAAMLHGQESALKSLLGAGGERPGFGFPLPWVYLIWIAVMLLLYPVCAWYARVKAKSKSAWFSYL